MKRLFCTIVIAISVISVFSQAFTTSQLKNIRWELYSPTKTGVQKDIRFTETQYIIHKVYPEFDSDITQTYPYYLSETKPYIFDFSQVGKNSSGKYLVVYVEQYQSMYVFNIISVSHDYLKISYCEGEMTIYKRQK